MSKSSFDFHLHVAACHCCIEKFTVYEKYSLSSTVNFITVENVNDFNT